MYSVQIYCELNDWFLRNKLTLNLNILGLQQ